MFYFLNFVLFSSLFNSSFALPSLSSVDFLNPKIAALEMFYVNLKNEYATVLRVSKQTARVASEMDQQALLLSASLHGSPVDMLRTRIEFGRIFDLCEAIQKLGLDLSSELNKIAEIKDSSRSSGLPIKLPILLLKINLTNRRLYKLKIQMEKNKYAMVILRSGCYEGADLLRRISNGEILAYRSNPSAGLEGNNGEAVNSGLVVETEDQIRGRAQ